LKYNTNVPASSLIGSAWYQAAATTTTTTEEGFANRLFSKSAGVFDLEEKSFLWIVQVSLDNSINYFSHSSNKLSLYIYTSIVAPPFAPPPAL
jgi:hypothetical protein